ncbi:TPA: sel1 repeat family protein, partial [Klebsiella pneumoniae]|nr:sel1 repeat family protein [Klebsiella pneumoniae]HBY4994773.1 sel1 repeat family protein [Klebsiella pneumoniae]
SGYWQPAWRPREGMSERAIRFFREGDIIPLDKKNLVRLRSCSLRDK